MGLQSALTTALTGLQSAETQIDVVGNNLANSQTVGFKQSDTRFAAQFVRTLGLGAAPSANNGGTNPRQVGLGVQVSEITPDFTQGTIEGSGLSSDLALQGDGFFVVQGENGDQLYTRNGIFNINSENQLVTITGQRLLGHTVDDNFQLVTTQLDALTIPIGSTAVAQPTQNVFMEGTLSPTGDLADTAAVVQSAVLGNGSVPRPDASGSVVTVAATPDASGSTATSANVAGGSLAVGDTFDYKFTFADTNGTESTSSIVLTETVLAGDNAINLANLPASPLSNPPTADYPLVNVYRSVSGADDFRFLAQVAESTSAFADDGNTAVGAPIDETTIDGNYSYLVTFFKAGEEESRPSELLGPVNVADGRIQLRDLPIPPIPGPGDSFPAYDKVRIYRNLATDSSSFFLVDTIDPGENYTDNNSDAAISLNLTIDLDGPKIDANTLLVDVVSRDALNFENVFVEGTLEFTPNKGERTLATKSFDVAADTTVQQLLTFMEEALGIQVAADDLANPIPGSVNTIPGESGTLAQGLSIVNGRVRIVGNNGVDNAIVVPLSSFKLTDGAGAISTPNLGFGTVQSAVGQSAVADLIAFDSLGIPLQVRVTAVLESQSGVSTTYRWFADSPDNDPLSGVDISVGTGLITFDGEGNLTASTNTTVSIDRRNVPSQSPLDFDLDFAQLSGLAAEESTLAAVRQDGSAPGELSTFAIGENGTIRGSFTNGVTRTLGQVRLARFSNPIGLEQRGENLFAAGANSGLPVEANPGQQGLATIVAGALELSNTDVGQNLITLVLASTQFRGNARVITSSQQLLDELLNLRR